MPNETDRDEELRKMRRLLDSFARNKQGYPITQQQWDRAIRLIEDWLSEFTGERPHASKSAIRVEIKEAREILIENDLRLASRDARALEMSDEETRNTP